MLPRIEQYALLQMTTHTVFVFSSIDSLKAMQQHERQVGWELQEAHRQVEIKPGVLYFEGM